MRVSYYCNRFFGPKLNFEENLISHWWYFLLMTLHVDCKSGEVCTCFWLTLPDFMVFLCSGNYLLYQNDNNKMATDVTFMWINKWIFLIVAHFRVVGIFDWILLIEVFQMRIFNRIILSSILELLLWSTGKICTCFKKYWFHVKSHQK